MVLPSERRLVPLLLIALQRPGTAEPADSGVGRVVLGEHPLAHAVDDDGAAGGFAVPGRERPSALVDHVAVTGVAQRDVAQAADVGFTARGLDSTRQHSARLLVGMQGGWWGDGR